MPRFSGPGQGKSGGAEEVRVADLIRRQLRRKRSSNFEEIFSDVAGRIEDAHGADRRGIVGEKVTGWKPVAQ